MADIHDRNVNTSFTGLTTTAGIFAVVGGICLVGFETLRQLRRLPNTHFARFWRKNWRLRQGKGGVDAGDATGKGLGERDHLTCEDWEMGHLYMARMFHATTPSPPLARWPLAWAYQAIKFTDWFYATHTGMDTVVYVRFLRAMVYYLTLHTVTTAPILLAINFTFSSGASLKDMSAASISYLVTIPVDPDCTDLSSADCKKIPNEQGRSLLWIHLCMVWWVSITWVIALWWIASGSLRIRRRLIDKVVEDRKARKEATRTREATSVGPDVAGGLVREDVGLVDDSEGWRQRTLMVLNLPSTMRDEASIRRYFEEFLRPDDEISIHSGGQRSGSADYAHSRDGTTSTNGAMGVSKIVGTESLDTRPDQTLVEMSNSAPSGTDPLTREEPTSDAPLGPEPDINPDRHLRSPVQTVVLVRKMNELSAMLSRRQEVLAQLEAAHIKLARNVMQAVGKNTVKMRKRAKKLGSAGGLASATAREPKSAPAQDPVQDSKKKGGDEGGDDDDDDDDGTEKDIEKDAVDLSNAAKLDDLTRRLARFSPANQGHHVREAQIRGSTEDDANEMHETVWEALAEVPRELLDAHQPATRLSALFRGQTVPTIDYLLTKLNLLTALVTEMRARPPSSYEPTSTAFVTFRDPRQARMVWRELKGQIVIRVRLAPEVKDLDWERLMRTSFTGDIVRGVGVNAFFWGFTIFWVIPIQILTTGLFSVKNLRLVFPPVNDFFNHYPGVEAFVSVTLPTVLVSLIAMSVPELIFQISKRAQGFVTFSALYDQCLCRYWKFIICNVVIFFCIGVTTIEAILQQVEVSGSTLLSISFSFPAAAPFFVSYLILGMALHTGFELFGFMVPLLQHLGARKAFTPRIRALKTLPRNFNRYYWLPFHTLIMSIVFIFAILNPLIIPFALIYAFCAMVVFKKNLAYLYFRRFNEINGVVYFTRILRFSLDGLLVSQIVLLVFFAVTNQRAVYIGLTAVLTPLTVSLKLLATRLWQSQCRALDDDEASALCGISIRRRTGGGPDRDYGEDVQGDESYDSRSPLDARASGRYPNILPAPTTGSRFYKVWQRVHDSFNANGYDKPSYIVTSAHKGQRIDNPAGVGKTFASLPISAAKGAISGVQNYRHAAKAIHQMNKSEAEQEEQNKASKPVTTSHEMLEIAREGQRKRRKRSKGIQRANSTRSEEAPFLSGFDAVTSHAPVGSDAGEASFMDGDESEYLSRMSRSGSGMGRRRSSRRNISGSRDKSDRYDDEKTAVSTAEGGISHLYTPRESEEGMGYEEDEDNVNGEYYDEDDDVEASRPLVTPHASVRWDDTPNNHARYNNPFYNTELDPFLWFPRDPLALVDLCDTVEWHGPALVSSQGGAGAVGEWDEEDEEVETRLEGGETGSEDDEGIEAIEGDEQIFLPDSLARHLEGVEEVENAPDVAASLPRNVMADYKRAIRRSSRSEDNGSVASHRIKRNDSIVSHGSFRSPTLSARMRVDHERPPSPIDLRMSSPEDSRKAVEDSTEAAGAPAAPATPQPAKTHFASTVTGHEHKTPQPNLPTGVSSDGRIVSTPAGVSFAAGAGLDRTTGHYGSHSRYGTGTSAVSGASFRSNGASINRTISMKKALQAEVLEEERRLVVKERMGTLKRKTTTLRRKHNSKDAEANLQIEEAAATTLGRSDTIMGRHEAALQRRRERSEAAGSVYDSDTAHMRNTPHSRQGSGRWARDSAAGGESSTSPTHPRHGSGRFDVRSLGFSKASQRRGAGGTRDQDGANSGATSGAAGDGAAPMQMQEFGVRPARLGGAGADDGLAPAPADVKRQRVLSAPSPSTATPVGDIFASAMATTKVPPVQGEVGPPAGSRAEESAEEKK